MWTWTKCSSFEREAMAVLQGVLLIIMCGFLAGELASKLNLPRLIGMLIAGIIIGPYSLNILPSEILAFSKEIRLIILLIVLFKAGLGLDRSKLTDRGSVAVRLGFVPALVETMFVAAATRLLLGWSWLICLLLGWIICAASPAVVVPMMLKLKSTGWGVDKGIPDLVLAGGTISDVVAVTMFGILLTMTTGQKTANLWLQAAEIPLHIVLAVIVGYLAARAAQGILRHLSLEHVVHEVIVSFGIALLLMFGEQYLPYSEFLAVMVMGFTILEQDTVLARRVRDEIDKVWTIGEIFLFVLIGAAVNIQIMWEAGPLGIAIIGIGLLLGRTLGICLSALGSDLNLAERGFLAVGQMAKATVQAAIGGLPLAAGVPHGDHILAIAVLSILVTAPVGAVGISLLAPKWLSKGQVDPTKITVREDLRFLVVIDQVPYSLNLVREASRLARQLDAEMIVLNTSPQSHKDGNRQLNRVLNKYAADVSHRIVSRVSHGGCPERLIQMTAEAEDIDYIFAGEKTLSRAEKTDVRNKKLRAVAVDKERSVPVVIVGD